MIIYESCINWIGTASVTRTVKKYYSQYEILILKNLYKRNTEIQIGIAPPRAKLENGECNPHHYYWYCTDLQKSHCNENVSAP